MYFFSFEKLEAYKEAMALTVGVYELAKRFPNYEKYALADQLRRAIVSIPSNIAESCGRSSFKEKIHFIEISFGSLFEALCQLQIASQLGYIEESDLKEIRPQFLTVSRLLNALRKSYQNTQNS